MVRHVVTFRLNGPEELRREVAARFRSALLGLPAQIPQLKEIEVGVNINPAEQWDVTLIATADSLDDIALYSAHPAHVRAVEIIAPHKAERACVDFIAE
ncbi:MAG: Dabb family protein [Paramuribaculum sp.]|nr:Dabb family protein [Paramuribaculum sp.]